MPKKEYPLHIVVAMPSDISSRKEEELKIADPESDYEITYARVTTINGHIDQLPC